MILLSKYPTNPVHIIITHSLILESNFDYTHGTECMPSIDHAVDLIGTIQGNLAGGIFFIYRQLRSFSLSFIQIYKHIWELIYMEFAMIHGKSILSVSNEHFLPSSCLNLTHCLDSHLSSKTQILSSGWPTLYVIYF